MTEMSRHCLRCAGWQETAGGDCPGVEACGHDVLKLDARIASLCDAFEANKRTLTAVETERDTLQAKLDAVVGALRTVADWRLPTAVNGHTGEPCSFESEYGSNGARDYMRAVARTALDAASKAIEMRGEAAASDQPCEHNWFHDTCQRCSATRAIPPAPRVVAAWLDARRERMYSGDSETEKIANTTLEFAAHDLRRTSGLSPVVDPPAPAAEPVARIKRCCDPEGHPLTCHCEFGP